MHSQLIETSNEQNSNKLLNKLDSFMQQVDLQEFITQIFNIVKPVANALTIFNTFNL